MQNTLSLHPEKGGLSSMSSGTECYFSFRHTILLHQP
jgi:hypothetical protein